MFFLVSRYTFRLLLYLITECGAPFKRSTTIPCTAEKQK